VIIPGSGVRTDLLTPSADSGASLRASLKLEGASVVVLMVSRVLRSKGVLELAHAARQVRRADPTIAFLLAGPADDASLDALTEHELAELRREVQWLGARDDVKELLALADIFVFPSFYREGVPRVLLEAASMGLPLVAADAAGSRDVVDDGVNGFLVPPQDAPAIAQAVLRLAREPELRSRFGAESRRRAIDEFDLAVIAERTASLYRELLATDHP
jgi:glycosyltransferase involved in cell wall biosynthesis